MNAVNRFTRRLGFLVVPCPPSAKMLHEHANVSECHHPSRGGNTVRWDAARRRLHGRWVVSTGEMTSFGEMARVIDDLGIIVRNARRAQRLSNRELDRRLAVAKNATHATINRWAVDVAGPVASLAWLGPSHDVFTSNWMQAAFIALHDPADAIRRYTGELEVLERHRLCRCEDWAHCVCSHGGVWPCPEIRSLASRLGVSVDG